MELNELIGKEVIHKGNKCPVLQVAKGGQSETLLQLKVVATETTKDTIWCDIDETRINVYFTERHMMFGIMVDAYDGYAKVEWKDAEGITVPFRPDPKTGYLMLDKENRPMMMMRVFDTPLAEISLY